MPSIATPSTSASKLTFIKKEEGQVIRQYKSICNDLDFIYSAGKGLNIFISTGGIECQRRVTS